MVSLTTVPVRSARLKSFPLFLCSTLSIAYASSNIYDLQPSDFAVFCASNVFALVTQSQSHPLTDALPF